MKEFVKAFGIIGAVVFIPILAMFGVGILFANIIVPRFGQDAADTIGIFCAIFFMIAVGSYYLRAAFFMREEADKKLKNLKHRAEKESS